MAIRKNEKLFGLMKDEIDGQIMKEFVGLRAKIYSYLEVKNHEDRKITKNCVITRTSLNSQDNKNCLEAAQIENKINHLERTRIDVDGLKKVHKDFIKSNKLISKTE